MATWVLYYFCYLCAIGLLLFNELNVVLLFYFVWIVQKPVIVPIEPTNLSKHHILLTFFRPITQCLFSARLLKTSKCFKHINFSEPFIGRYFCCFAYQQVKTRCKRYCLRPEQTSINLPLSGSLQFFSQIYASLIVLKLLSK